MTGASGRKEPGPIAGLWCLAMPVACAGGHGAERARANALRQPGNDVVAVVSRSAISGAAEAVHSS